MDIKIEGKTMEELRKILEYPPYLIFLFVSAIFVVVSIIEKIYFDQIFIFFLYSVFGSVWRYIEKDMLSGIQKVTKEESKNKLNLTVISIYHIGNLGLLVALFHYLKNFF